MFQPEYIENVSLIVSEVLADIGVDERIVKKRRRTYLLRESMETISVQQNGINGLTYCLGSQSEASTTPGLNSDIDELLCHNDFNVLQDWSNWEPGVHNYLMIEDDTVTPGYCLLQRLRDDAPLPYTDIPNENHFSDGFGRILLKNKVMSDALARLNRGGIRHGPAYTQQRQPWCMDHEIVGAYRCKSWPLQARQWLDQQGVGLWPSDEMMRYCSSTGCFLVAVGSKGSEHEEFEWRISTSLPERCLMFNLNITQIRCYILMKMILKTFIKPRFDDTISSFMCKSVLFHCITNKHSYVWRENNLLVCLSWCLFVLQNTILNENCPHFIIQKNNLMRGHIPHKSKPFILEILQKFIISAGKALLEIACDDLGARIQLKFIDICPSKTSDIISGQLLFMTAETISINLDECLTSIMVSNDEMIIPKLLKNIRKIATISKKCPKLIKTASNIFAAQYCTLLGSVLASHNIQQYNALSAEALTLISLGLNTDVASSKLKLASMLYCIGDTQRTEIVLRDIEANYDLNSVEPVCNCHKFLKQTPKSGFNAICDNHNEEAIQYTTALCVRFLPCEINCVPHELRQEMFRSTQEDLAFRGWLDEWMDWAVVDSLPYLYFLLYKSYNHLGRHDEKQSALSKLVITIDQEPNLGHRETALNLLGQLMEQEDRAREALYCYSKSINVRERNNAAKIHICRLLSALINDKFFKQ